MDTGKFVNLVKETELGLFRANKQLRELSKVSKGIEAVLANLLLIEHSAERDAKLRKELVEQLKQRKLVSQSTELFKQLALLGKNVGMLSEIMEKARPFVERHRTSRLYSFDSSADAVKFARQLFEMFSCEKIVFKPRFIGPLEFHEIALKLKLENADPGLFLQPKDIKLFVKAMSEKKFVSNISLEAAGLKLIWQDKKTIVVESSSEKLGRLDRLCEALDGKCFER